LRIHIIAVGERMPAWVDAAFRDYAGRLRGACRVTLTEIAAGKRGKAADLRQIAADEGARLLAAVPAGCRLIALDREGRAPSSTELAEALGDWLAGGRDAALLIGGPEGLAPDCLARADAVWSLSRLTLPHALVRVVVAEQLFRAWSILNRLPYHR
jgi:23S rRNA (pseudouridine1915-N3)-methyltransferase